MNFFQLLLNFLKRMFGVKSANPSPKPDHKPKVNKPEKTNPPIPKVKEEIKEKPPEKMLFEIPDVTLSLGSVDAAVEQAAIESLLAVYHRNLFGEAEAVKKSHFRHSDIIDTAGVSASKGESWVSPQREEGEPVKKLQQFLLRAEFFPPHAVADGIFGYATQSGVRLFQEYVRTIEKLSDIGLPDGVVGPKVWQHIKRWEENRLTADRWTRGKPSPEFEKWLNSLRKAKEFYLQQSHEILDRVNNKIQELASKGQKTDTLATKDWVTDPDEVHLIGIRRKEEDSKGLRQNDDVFILLINGMVFKFWGSTDPNHGKKVRKDEAFLAEGQHKFRFGWHNRSEARKRKAYQGLNPYQHGVLVFRDWDDDNKLTEKDIRGRGLDNAPNHSINIHWTGLGQGASGTWSEGCQVIAGKNYINQNGELIDCSAFAAGGSADLMNQSARSMKKTKAAYNVFADLLLLYAPRRVDYLYYTLGRDETLTLDVLVQFDGTAMLADTVKVFDLPEERGLA